MGNTISVNREEPKSQRYILGRKLWALKREHGTVDMIGTEAEQLIKKIDPKLLPKYRFLRGERAQA
jgi:hypothetical protein